MNADQKSADLNRIGSAERLFRADKSTIFVVEDEMNVRRLMCRLLSASGYHVMDAADAPAACHLWEAHREEIDLLLVDMLLPGEMNGPTLAALLLRERPELKVVYTSGFCAELLENDLGTGFRFVQKPFVAGELLNVVQETLQNSWYVARSDC